MFAYFKGAKIVCWLCRLSFCWISVLRTVCIWVTVCPSSFETQTFTLDKQNGSRFFQAHGKVNSQIGSFLPVMGKEDKNYTLIWTPSCDTK